MNAIERAETYAALFIRCEESGRDWRECVPDDGVRTGAGAVQIGPVELSRVDSRTWRMSSPSGVQLVRRREGVAA